MPLTISLETRLMPLDLTDATRLGPLRDHFGLTGAKVGCGVGLRGACAVFLDSVAARSRLMRAGDAEGSSVRTGEGLGRDEALHPVQQTWLDIAVPQCGYFQAGQIMAAVALLDATPQPTHAEIDTGIDGNPGRCGTYGRIRAAIARVATGA